MIEKPLLSPWVGGTYQFKNFLRGGGLISNYDLMKLKILDDKCFYKRMCLYGSCNFV